MTRRAAVLAALLVAVAAGASAAPVWFRAVTTVPTGPVPVAVPGGDAAPGVAAGALVVAAAGLALALGRRVGTALAGAGLILGGSLVVVSAVGAQQGAERIAVSAARAVAGVGEIDGGVAVAAWPWVAAGCGAAAALLGLAVPWAARAWRGPSTRHEAVGATAAEPVTSAPSAAAAPAPAADGATTGTGASHAPPTSDAGPGGRLRPGDDAGAAWDALSRGEDPS